jgi:hypothetical protein
MGSFAPVPTAAPSMNLNHILNFNDAMLAGPWFFLAKTTKFVERANLSA